MTSPENSQTDELKSTIASLETLGCRLTNMIDHGASGYVAEFAKKGLKFSIVKDQGYWHLGGNKALDGSPSRMSLSLVTKDATIWIKKKKT